MAKKKTTKKIVKSKPKPVAKKKTVKAKTASKKPAPKPLKKPTSVSPYLNFQGNCEEAFVFYKSVFKGKFSNVNRFKEMPSPDGTPMPEFLQEKIMHISLPISAETVLMGSDNIEGFGPPFIAGNNFTVSINASSKPTADKLFTGLSEGGTITMPLENTFWGSYFGMFTDKFGIQWMVSYDKNQK